MKHTYSPNRGLAQFVCSGVIQKHTISGCSAVGSAPGLGPGGRRFEPGHPDKNYKMKKYLDNL